MGRVTGIGGFFFRARDPEALNRWYAEHFGVVMVESRGYEDPGWFQDRGETVFAAFAQDSDSFGSADKSWKINFRVEDLDGVVAGLLGADIGVDVHPQSHPNGRFAELVDPEGNCIQLWEPNAASLERDPSNRGGTRR